MNQQKESNKTESFEYQSVQVLKGVGPSVAEKLTRLEIYNIQDILFHLPLRYEDRTRITPLGSLQAGQHVLIEGVIGHSEIKFGGRGRRSLMCHLSDNTGAVILRFFYFNKTQQSNLSSGTRLRCFGEVRYISRPSAKNAATRFEIIHPEYQRLQQESLVIEESLTPVYPKTEGVHQTLLKKISDQVLQAIDQGQLIDWLPGSVIKKYQFPDLVKALFEVHRPPKNTDALVLEQCNSKAQQRLLFEELLAHQLSLLQVRAQIKKTKSASLPMSPSDYAGFKKKLSFELTRAQEKVIAEIYADINLTQPMLRLVQGDVGSGKTVVAAAAAMAVLRAGKQVAIMAPTGILAEQHYASYQQWFGADNCLLLTGRDKGKGRQQKLQQIASAQCQIIVGTHALFQNDVEFNQLALLVVDEQHRFGVHQRLALREKGKKNNAAPHQLIMTATPIPRSLAMTAYADLDYSVIDELPAGRKPVITVVLSNARRNDVIQRIEKACLSGEQAYWVCTLVEESELLQCQAAEVTAQQLTLELKGVSVGLVHGRMKADEKQKIIQRFKNNEIDLLVATTVIEVGVDVPNASLMVIENAERLGLAQLHQLRGRVGRGGKQSACVLMYQPPLSETGKQRLAILRETNDGFKVAQKDLELRGPGEMLGTRQTGLMQFRIADIVRDEHWFAEVKKTADYIISRHPQAVKPLVRRWLGKAERFANV
jgi:ATP-dependent DNA helicase RecG